MGNNTSITEHKRHYYRELLCIGVPIIIGQLGTIILGFADTLMIGHHSTEELAAAGLVNNIITFILVSYMGFSYGLTPIIGRLYGMEKTDKKALIITVAGTASRFNKDLDKETLKCLYFEGKPENSLLCQIIKNSADFDQYVIVGGYLYGDLQSFAEENLASLANRVTLVYNPHFKDYGSGYSLYVGIKAVKDDIDEVVFAEGDLFFDKQSMASVVNSPTSVLTTNHEAILSNKAVALYIDVHDHPKYIYDTNHKYLQIDEPFKAIYNSGQIWKFSNASLLKGIVQNLNDKEQQGTNLVIVQKYFDAFEGGVDALPIDIWFNCNTVFDYRNVLKIIENENN